MSFSLILLAILILAIAITSCPGFVAFIVTIGVSAAIIAVVVAYFRTKKELKSFNKILDEIPSKPWDNDL